uniref:TPR repeat-containing protein n=1 Tax=bacterium enrichment culture clone g13 TaxID=1091412 RepID=G4WWD7_9BACT|nr:TPR repeat-containing protein [bacterium enrichment culture clone g13]
MQIEILLNGLTEAAKSPLSYVAYIVITISWAAITWKEARIKNITKALSLLPEGRRLDALKLEYRLIPKEGLNSEEYLRHESKKYYFLAFSISAIAVLIITTLGIYRAIELDKQKVVGETISIAYETFIRGTTTADDNRFATAIGKIEESVRISPSYSGYVNLADIYEEVGEVDKAIWASQKAAELDPTNPSPENMIGMLLKDKGNLDEAEQHLLRAMSLFEESKIKDDEFKVTILVNTGNVYYERAEASSDASKKIQYAETAIKKYYEPSLILRGGLQNKRFLANLLGNTANSYRILGDFKKAEELAFQSIAIKESLAKSSPLWNSLGIGYFNLGDIYLKQGATDEAMKYFDKSEDIFDASGSIIGKGSVSLSKAEIAKMKGDIDSARKHAELARSSFASANLGLYEKKATDFISQLSAK